MRLKNPPVGGINKDTEKWCYKIINVIQCPVGNEEKEGNFFGDSAGISRLFVLFSGLLKDKHAGDAAGGFQQHQAVDYYQVIKYGTPALKTGSHGRYEDKRNGIDQYPSGLKIMNKGIG